MKKRAKYRYRYYDVKIENGIRIPHTRYEGIWKNALVNMDVGQSFSAPRNRMSSIHKAASLLKIKVCVRRDPKNPQRIRAWKMTDIRKVEPPPQMFDRSLTFLKAV